jgi:hypothetical protein
MWAFSKRWALPLVHIPHILATVITCGGLTSDVGFSVLQISVVWFALEQRSEFNLEHTVLNV